MYCRNCGQRQEDGQRICLICGFEPTVGEDFCPECGIKVEPEQAICVACKTSLERKPEEESEKRKRLFPRYRDGLVSYGKSNLLSHISACLLVLSLLFLPLYTINTADLPNHPSQFSLFDEIYNIVGCMGDFLSGNTEVYGNINIGDVASRFFKDATVLIFLALVMVVIAKKAIVSLYRQITVPKDMRALEVYAEMRRIGTEKDLKPILNIPPSAFLLELTLTDIVFVAVIKYIFTYSSVQTLRFMPFVSGFTGFVAVPLLLFAACTLLNIYSLRIGRKTLVKMARDDVDGDTAEA